MGYKPRQTVHDPQRTGAPDLKLYEEGERKHRPQPVRLAVCLLHMLDYLAKDDDPASAELRNALKPILEGIVNGS